MASCRGKVESTRQHQPTAIAALLARTQPVENIWQYLRQNYLANRVFDNYQAIVDACCNAWNALIAAPQTIRSIASREWAKTVSP
jgi:hypothetical protein